MVIQGRYNHSNLYSGDIKIILVKLIVYRHCSRYPKGSHLDQFVSSLISTSPLPGRLEPIFQSVLALPLSLIRLSSLVILFALTLRLETGEGVVYSVMAFPLARAFALCASRSS